jgi:hypothetical protein
MAEEAIRAPVLVLLAFIASTVARSAEPDSMPIALADEALTRRYYKGVQVHNFCLRERVFVANKILLGRCA